MMKFLNELLRFGIIGILAAVTHFSVVTTLVEITHLAPLTANIYGFIISFIVSFSGHHFWTFSNNDNSVTIHTALPRFFCIATLNFGSNQTLYYLLLTRLHMPYMPALITVLGTMAAVAFILSKLWAFR